VALPPLHTLRVFEAAARHRSFTRAARELHVTHGAVSRQIKALAGFVGAPLFVRAGRDMLPTPAAAALRDAVAAAFAHLDEALVAAAGRAPARPLVVSVLPSFAARWLVTRLPDFAARHPDIDVLLRATPIAEELGDGVDVVVRYGRGGWPGLEAVCLFREELFPVCSPRFRGGRLPRRPRDLLAVPLLHDVDEPWELWLRAMGVLQPAPRAGLSFNDSSHLLAAAVAGQGVALARSVLAADEIAAGRLVRVGRGVPARRAYYAAWPRRGADPRVTAFVRWLMAIKRARRTRLG
jgi:LysR family glycine cleavage system transcriptional activator